MKPIASLASIAMASLAACFAAGCSYAANDEAVLTEYYDHIEYLNRSPEVADPGSRYRIAREFFDEVDVAGIKEKELLLKLVGKPTKVSGSGDEQTLEYDFVSPADGPAITAVFKCKGQKVLSGKVHGI